MAIVYHCDLQDTKNCLKVIESRANNLKIDSANKNKPIFNVLHSLPIDLRCISRAAPKIGLGTLQQTYWLNSITLICTYHGFVLFLASIHFHLVGFASITFRDFLEKFCKTFHISESFDWASLYCSVKLESWTCKDVENKPLVGDWVLSNWAKTVRAVRREITQQKSAKPWCFRNRHQIYCSMASWFNNLCFNHLFN